MRIATVIAIGLALAGCDGIDMPGRADGYNPHSAHAISIHMPPNANFISQNFQPAIERGPSGHLGMDVWGKIRTPILAAMAGRVSASFYDPMYGNQIVVDHGIAPDGRRLVTAYKHLKTAGVVEGDRVARGQQIGTMGATGLLGMMVHLHFEVQRSTRDGRLVAEDPHLYWLDGPGRVTCHDPARGTAGDAEFLLTYPVICGG
ncbi:MAG: M23 family metallopeptidase [Rhodobacteraceae bacterium]|nr:M23 family metallopeptidase [Paracoccaceae bacterium]